MTRGNEAINWLQRGRRSCSRRNTRADLTGHNTLMLPRFDRFKEVNMYPKLLAGADLNSVGHSVANVVVGNFSGLILANTDEETKDIKAELCHLSCQDGSLGTASCSWPTLKVVQMTC